MELVKIVVALFILFIILISISLSYYKKDKKIAVNIAFLGTMTIFAISGITLFVIPPVGKTYLIVLALSAIAVGALFRTMFLMDCKRYNSALKQTFFGSSVMIIAIIIQAY